MSPTFVTASWNVRSATGCAVAFDIRLCIRSSESLGRDTLKTVVIWDFVTVISVGWSGSAELNSHSSSVAAGAELPLLLPMPSRSRLPPDDGAGALDCACWNGDACRDGVPRAANGSDFFG